MPSVSIVLPVYNGAATLTDAIDSICKQTFTDWELIIINDGSTDKSSEIADRFVQQDTRIRLYNETHQGLPTALNIGLSHAKASYIARMDADDISYSTRLQLQYDYMRNHPECDLLAGCAKYVGNEEGFQQFVDWSNSIQSMDDIYLNRFVESPLIHPTVMYKRSCIEKWGDYREGPFPEDYELWLRWMNNSACIHKLNTSVIQWIDHKERYTRIDPHCSTENFYSIKAHYLAEYLKTTAKNRPLWIWGAGRQTRKRVEVLMRHEVQIAGYIDIDTKKVNQSFNGQPVILPDELDKATHPYIISYVGNRGGRENIRQWLNDKGYSEGADYICAA